MATEQEKKRELQTIRANELFYTLTYEEREEVINFIKQEGTAEYSDEIMATIEKAADDKNQDNGKNGGAAAEADSDYDELLPQAVYVIFDTKQASVRNHSRWRE